MGPAGMVFSMISIAVGSVMYWAVASQGHGLRLSKAGVILIVVGALGLVTRPPFSPRRVTLLEIGIARTTSG
jgi:uncharacterized membrane protein YvlD (DUF360 family)